MEDSLQLHYASVTGHVVISASAAEHDNNGYLCPSLTATSDSNSSSDSEGPSNSSWSESENENDHSYQAKLFTKRASNIATTYDFSPSVDDHLSSVVLQTVVTLPTQTMTMPQFTNSLITTSAETASFLVCNLAAVSSQLDKWHLQLPNVEPFYAVKCNPDPAIIRLLASKGCGFDCATMGEIDIVCNGLSSNLNFGRQKAADKIVYANPAKMEHMLQFANKSGVQMTVVDSVDELIKIANLPNNIGESFKILIRITTDDKSSVCRFSKKFGCPYAETRDLLVVAQRLNLQIVGVSFHVGSGCGDGNAYTIALNDCINIFKDAVELGMPELTVIDLGGGWPGDDGLGLAGGDTMPSFEELAETTRKGMTMVGQKLNRDIETIRFIAEPGRYFVSSCTSIATKCYARKGGNKDYQALYVDDGVYGSFNTVVYDHAHPIPQRLLSIVNPNANENERCISTAVFGPTCDGLDQLCDIDNTMLPRVETNEWLYFADQGAYTHTASFIFNGYTHFPNKYYVNVE